MPKESRLSRTNFKEMRGFRRIQGRFFSLSFGTIPGRTVGGAACVVSKKVAARAAKRNLLKRRCRAVLSRVLKETQTPLVVVCTAKKGSTEASFAEIRTEIEALVARAAGAR